MFVVLFCSWLVIRVCVVSVGGMFGLLFVLVCVVVWWLLLSCSLLLYAAFVVECVLFWCVCVYYVCDVFAIRVCVVFVVLCSV